MNTRDTSVRPNRWNFRTVNATERTVAYSFRYSDFNLGETPLTRLNIPPEVQQEVEKAVGTFHVTYVVSPQMLSMILGLVPNLGLHRKNNTLTERGEALSRYVNDPALNGDGEASSLAALPQIPPQKVRNEPLVPS